MGNRNAAASLTTLLLLANAPCTGCTGFYDAMQKPLGDVSGFFMNNHLIDPNHPWHADAGTAVGIPAMFLASIPLFPFMFLESALGGGFDEKRTCISHTLALSIGAAVGTVAAVPAFAMTLSQECESHSRAAKPASTKDEAPRTGAPSSKGTVTGGRQ